MTGARRFCFFFYFYLLFVRVRYFALLSLPFRECRPCVSCSSPAYQINFRDVGILLCSIIMNMLSHCLSTMPNHKRIPSHKIFMSYMEPFGSRCSIGSFNEKKTPIGNIRFIGGEDLSCECVRVECIGDTRLVSIYHQFPTIKRIMWTNNDSWNVSFHPK